MLLNIYNYWKEFFFNFGKEDITIKLVISMCINNYTCKELGKINILTCLSEICLIGNNVN